MDFIIQGIFGTDLARFFKILNFLLGAAQLARGPNI
jgi:hypothetical protein